jgi:hypothetical protein
VIIRWDVANPYTKLSKSSKLAMSTQMHYQEDQFCGPGIGIWYIQDDQIGFTRTKKKHSSSARRGKKIIQTKF